MNKPDKLYLVWSEEDQFFQQFDTLEDAVTYENFSKPVEVYEANIKFLGNFKRKTSIVKVKNNK